MAPFSEIKGFGKSAEKAEKLTAGSIKTNSFFIVKEKVKGQSKFEHVLKITNAYDDRDVTRDIDDYFDIPVSLDYSITHPKLVKFVGKKMTDEQYSEVEHGYKFVRKVIGLSKTKDAVFNCVYCKDEYPDPIFMENGKISGMVIMERPTKSEFNDGGNGFFANRTLKSFKRKLKKGGLNLDQFYMSYLVKCYEEEKSEESVVKCSPCLDKDIEYAKPKFIISIGSGPAKFFLEDESVMRLSGSVLWNEKYNCFIFYLMSPFMGRKEDLAGRWKTDVENLIYYYKDWRLI